MASSISATGYDQSAIRSPEGAGAHREIECDAVRSKDRAHIEGAIPHRNGEGGPRAEGAWWAGMRANAMRESELTPEGTGDLREMPPRILDPRSAPLFVWNTSTKLTIRRAAPAVASRGTPEPEPAWFPSAGAKPSLRSRSARE